MSNITILIAEDEFPIRSAEKAALRRFEGIEVAEAADGAEALELIEQLRPQILVLDMMMPEVDGLGVLRSLRTASAEAAAPKVLVMTALVKPGLAEELEALGVRHMMTKPFRLAEFSDKINQMLSELALTVI